MSDLLKLEHTLTIEIDPGAWEFIYGISGEQNIREDVRTWVHELISVALVQNEVVQESDHAVTTISQPSGDATAALAVELERWKRRARTAEAAADEHRRHAEDAESALARHITRLLTFDPCGGGEEQTELHQRVCVPFYGAREAAFAEDPDLNPDVAVMSGGESA